MCSIVSYEEHITYQSDGQTQNPRPAFTSGASRGDSGRHLNIYMYIYTHSYNCIPKDFTHVLAASGLSPRPDCPSPGAPNPQRLAGLQLQQKEQRPTASSEDLVPRHG